MNPREYYERRLVGGTLAVPGAFAKAVGTHPTDFSDPDLARIWGVQCELADREVPPSLAEVGRALLATDDFDEAKRLAILANDLTDEFGVTGAYVADDAAAVRDHRRISAIRSAARRLADDPANERLQQQVLDLIGAGT